MSIPDLNPPIPVNQPLKTLPTGKKFAYVECNVPECAVVGTEVQAAVAALGGQFQNFKQGNDTVEFTVDDAQGQPQDGLSLAVVPFMPAMKHGTSVVPTVTAAGQGRYVAANVVLFMPGTWELRTTITGAVGAASDTLAPAFEVP